MREFESNRTYPLETPLGEVLLTPTKADHIFLDGSGNGRRLQVNGVGVAASLHLGFYEGAWGPWHDKSGQTYHALYTSRGDTSGKDVSDAARKKLLAVLVPAVQKWADEHPEALREAEARHLNNEIRSRQEDLQKAEEQVNRLRAEIVALEEQEAAL